MRRIKSFLILICLLSIYTVFLYGCEKKERSDSHNNEVGLPEIVIGSDNYPPYNYVDTDGNATGIDVELATEAFKRMGYKARFIYIDWEDKKNLLADRTIDCAWGSFSMDGRENEYRWAGPYMISRQVVAVNMESDIYSLEDLEGKSVVLAGRMMSKRVMGKASFCNIQDLQGNIQSYVARDSIGEEEYKAFKKMDIGDIVGLEGEVFKTKTGEISIHASKVTLLSKSLQILPEKFHGLTNTDIRYRQRYVDLIMNADVKETFIKRSRILSAVRRLSLIHI